MQLLHQGWLSGGLAARSQYARAGMKVLTQLWEAQSSSHMPRLHARLNATILEEVRPGYSLICVSSQSLPVVPFCLVFTCFLGLEAHILKRQHCSFGFCLTSASGLMHKAAVYSLQLIFLQNACRLGILDAHVR